MDLSFCFLCFCSVCSSILLLILLLLVIGGSSLTHFSFGSSKRKFYYHHQGDMSIIMQNLTERVRPLVGLNGWDYCVYWKLSEDQRFVEWLGCCCAGTENNQNDGEEHLFPFSSVASSCRDTMFPHPIMKTCYLLSQLPTSIPLDTGIHAQTLLTNQPNWVNYSNSLDSNNLEETIGTKVLIPVPGGLVELFVTKQVPEDHQVIDFITAQCIVLVDQEAVNNHSMSFNIDVNSIGNNMQSNHQLVSDEYKGNNNHRNSNHPFPLTTTAPPDSSSLPHDISLDHIGLCNSPLNFMHHHQFNYDNQGSFLHEKQTNNDECMNNMNDHTQDMQQYVEPLDTKDNQKQLGHKGSDSMSDCSDQNEEEDDGKYRRRNGKGNQSKNLVAERKRRKKLNDRLYNLRSLVPRISKLDRASILGDAIEYVKDLQKQVKELQDELEENSDTGVESNCMINNNNNQHVGVKQPADIVNGGEHGPKPEHCKTQNGFHVGTSGNGYISKQKQEVDASTIDKQTQQMEPQVEVALIDGNEYFVKVFSEHRQGGFVKLMEALNTLGMDVVHATVTSHKGLVSNVFKVEKKGSEMVEAEDVRDSLLELTRNPCRGWNHEMTATSENGDQHHLHNHQMGAYHPHQFHT